MRPLERWRVRGVLGGAPPASRRCATATDTLRSRNRFSRSLRKPGCCSIRRSIKSSPSSNGTSCNDGLPLTVTTTGSPWHSRPYRLSFALASLSGTTFMSGNSLALHVQRASPFLPDQDDSDRRFSLGNCKQHPVSTKKPQLTFRHLVRSQCFEMLRLSQRGFRQTRAGFFQHSSSLFNAEVLKVINIYSLRSARQSRHQTIL